MRDVDVWGEYRDRVEREHPNYGRARFRRAIEGLLAELKALDGKMGKLARPLPAAEFATLSEVLDAIRRQQAAAVGIGPERDYARWYAEFVAALGAGTVDSEGWARAERLGSLLFVSERINGLRQVAPQPPGPSLAASNEAQVRNPAIVVASRPLARRFGEIIARVAPGSADADVDAELEKLLADERALAERTEPGTPDRTDSDFRIGMVLNQLGRSAAFQGNGKAAGWYAQAAEVWRSLGDEEQVADCLHRSTLALLAEDGDVDRALERMLGELDRQPREPTVYRAGLLVQIASALAKAGDAFDAATRICESAATLAALGFADPTGTGAEQLFEAWMTNGRTNDRTHATLSVVTTLWASITEVRVDLPPADRERSGTDASDAVLAALLSELARLANRLGSEARAANARIDADMEALMPPVTAVTHPPLAPQDPACAGNRALEPDGGDEPGPVPDPPLPAADVLAEGRRIAAALNDLRDRYDVTEDEPGLDAILAEAVELELAAAEARLPALAATAALLRGDTLSWLGRNGECAEILATACENLERASGIADSERRTLLVRLLIRATMAHTIDGDFAGSSSAAERGIAIAELDRGKASSPYLQDSYLRERRRLYDAGVFAAFRVDDRDLLLRRAELAKARGSLGWIAGRAAEAGGGVGADADDPDGADSQPSDTERPGLEAEFRAVATRAGEDATAMARRRVLWTRLVSDRARRHGAAALAPFGLRAVQARLDPRDAVVYHYWLTRTTLLIVTIDARDTAVEKVDLAGSHDDLAELAADLATLNTEVRWLDEEIPRLGQLLMPREGAALLENKRHLLISPQGFLHQLPFHAFDWEGEPLISRFAVSYIPNLTTLLAERHLAAHDGGVFGLAVSTFPTAHPLKSAPNELAGVTAIYDARGTEVTTLLEGAATREHLDGLGANDKLQPFRVLHFATHGESGPSDDPFSARLLLADGHVDGLDITQWNLSAELVVLSACQVGQRAISGRSERSQSGDDPGEALFGDEMFGLPAAFFAAGAHEVLGALWPVKDEAALAIMPAMHEHLADGLPCDEALALAVDAYRNRNPEMFKWAPFKLVSIGRPTTITNR